MISMTASVLARKAIGNHARNARWLRAPNAWLLAARSTCGHVRTAPFPAQVTRSLATFIYIWAAGALDRSFSTTPPTQDVAPAHSVRDTSCARRRRATPRPAGSAAAQAGSRLLRGRARRRGAALDALNPRPIASFGCSLTDIPTSLHQPSCHWSLPVHCLWSLKTKLPLHLPH